MGRTTRSPSKVHCGQQNSDYTVPVQLLVTEARRKGVAYVSEERRGPTGQSSLTPVGTVFFVSIDEDDERTRSDYVVTARHCVETYCQTRQEIIIEFCDPAGSYRKVTTRPDEWIRSEDNDVAFRFARESEFGPCKKYSQEDFTNHSDLESFESGSDVFILGLFAGAPWRADSGFKLEPIVRFGKVALPSTTAPVFVDSNEREPARAKLVSAILLESVSFGGESGAPVFTYVPHQRMGHSAADVAGGYAFLTEETVASVATSEEIRTPLVGMISAHWVEPTNVEGEDGRHLEGRVPLNTGIAVAVPSHDILRFIIEHRKERQPKRRNYNPTRPLSGAKD